jgi:lipopolysaccharide transport protein LptA
MLALAACSDPESVPNPGPVSTPPPPDPASGPSQVATAFEITRTEAGEPGFRLHAERLLGRDGGVYQLLAPRVEWRQANGGTVFVSGREGSFDATSQAGRVEGDARAEDGAGAIVEAEALEHLAGGAAILAEGVARFRRPGLEGEGTGLRFDIAAQVLELTQDVKMRGVVPEGESGRGEWRLETAHLRYGVRAAEMICGPFTLASAEGLLRGDELRLVLASGTSRIVRAEAIGHAEMREGEPGSNEASGVAQGDRIVVVPGASAGEPPRRVEIRGSASLVPGERGGGLRELHAPSLDLSREIGSGERQVEATGGATARLLGARGEDGVLEAERIRAVIGADDQLLSGDAVGSVRYRGEEGAATANSLLIEAGGRRLLLAGTPTEAPSLTDASTEVKGQHLVIERDSGVLEARGDVRSVSTAVGSNGGLFDPTRPVHATADHLRAERDPDRATYEGGVRLWQGDSYLQADRAEIDRTLQSLEATGRVVTRAPAAGAPGGPPRWLEGRSSRFSYSEERRSALYRGDALLVDGEQRIAGEEIEIFLDERRALQSVRAERGVVLDAPGQHATAERLSYLPSQGTLFLYGGERQAEAQDTVHQRVVRGPTLTLKQLESRMNLESGPGGRTWITLDPQQKAAPAGDGSGHDDGGERQPL